MLITKIESQKKRKNRYNIYIDHEFKFGLDESVVLKFVLKEGDEIDQDLIDKIEKEEVASKAYNIALRFLKTRERSEKEIRDKLKEKNFSDRIIDLVLEKLKRLDFVDDRRFAEMFVKDRIKLKPKGKRVLKQELGQKGISDKIIEEVLGENLDEGKEIELAKRVFEKNIKRYSNLPPEQQKQKIIKYLLRKGFGWSVIEKFLNF